MCVSSQTLHIGDEHRPTLKADPVAVGELCQSPISDLSGGTDELCDSPLSQVVVRTKSRTFLNIETVNQLERGLSYAAWGIGEDKIGQRIIGAMQTTG